MTNGIEARLTLGPLLYNWPAERRRDFYFRIADEAPVDVVYLGEVACSKRSPFVDPLLPELAERLIAGGKEVVYSTLALVMEAREAAAIRELTEEPGILVEANDISAVALLAGRPHVVGPFINLYNEGTLAWMAGNGAIRVVPPAELDGAALAALARAAGPVGVEAQIFGRLPLALSARCYHARAHGLRKDGCRFVCEEDLDGMEVKTLDGENFLAVNGTQTISHAIQELAAAVPELLAMGVDHFRLWPQNVDMVAVARVYRDVLDGRDEPERAAARLTPITGFAPFTDGFYRGIEGARAV